MATISDVAELAGVSKSTASRALRGAGTVSAATRRRVSDAAEELAFVATPSATRLATGRTHTIAVVTPFVNRWFFAEAISGIQYELERSGFDLLLYDLHEPAVRSRFFDRMPVRRRVDGAVLLTLPVSRDEVQALQKLDVPLVFVGDQVSGSSSVRIDDRAGARLATQHLLNLGHRSLGFIGGDPSEPMRFAAPGQRRLGFEDAVGDAGVVVPGAHLSTADFTAAGGATAMARILGADRLPSAVFAACDEMAFGAIHTIRRMGLRVPHDVSVIGFDDHELAGLYGLTTVRQDVVQQGREAARAVLDLTAGSPTAVHRVAPTDLVVRETTSPVGRDAVPGPPERVSPRADDTPTARIAAGALERNNTR